MTQYLLKKSVLTAAIEIRHRAHAECIACLAKNARRLAPNPVRELMIIERHIDFLFLLPTSQQREGYTGTLLSRDLSQAPAAQLKSRLLHGNFHFSLMASNCCAAGSTYANAVF